MRALSVLVAATTVIPLFVAAGRTCQATTIDYNSSTDLFYFSRQNYGSYSPIAWSPGYGIGPSGSLVTSTAHASTLTSSRAFNHPGDTIYISQFFHAGDLSGLMPGFFGTYHETYLVHTASEFGNYDAHLFVSLESTSSVDRIEGGTLQAGGGSFPGFTFNFTKGTIRADHWYDFQVAFTNLGGQIQYGVRIDDYGLDGLNFLGTVFKHVTQTPDTQGFAADASLYPGFVVTGNGAHAVDNFSLDPFLVPEPASGWLLAQAAVLAMVVTTLRQRRRIK